MRKTARFAAVAMAAALTLSACGSDDGADEGTDNGDAPAATSDVKVGMAYDVGGRGDQSFNDSAAAGLDQAVEEFGMEAQESEAEEIGRAHV